MTVLIDMILLALLAVTAVAIVRVRNLFAVAMLGGIYSLVSACLFTTMNAPDVAFTEAAVGAGIATVLVLATLVLVGTEEARPHHTKILPLIAVLVTGGMLVYGTMDLPAFGGADNPAHQHVAPRYIAETPEAIGIPNIVTAVLASYRGYDTMGEVTVVFAAVVGVLILLASGGGAGAATGDSDRSSRQKDRKQSRGTRGSGGPSHRRSDRSPEEDR